MGGSYSLASKNQLLGWMVLGIVKVVESEEGVKVLKWTGFPDNDFKELTQRINKRSRSNRGGNRVDVRYQGYRISIHVSHLVWMSHTEQLLPPGYEIHHKDEDPTNDRWENLIALHPLDHLKFHKQESQVHF